MVILRTLILIGQVGRIWARTRTTRRVFQTAAAIGYYAILTQQARRIEQMHAREKERERLRNPVDQPRTALRPRPEPLKQRRSLWK
jgi:hypothetical protein